MKYAITLFICFFSIPSLLVQAQPSTLKWAKSFGNASNNDVSNAVCIDFKKDVFVTGTFAGTVDFNPSPTDTFNLTSTGSYSAFIVKFDSLGNFIWAKSFGGSSYANPSTIVADSNGNIITAGSFYQTVDFDPSASVYNLTSMGTGGGVFPSPAPSLFIQKLDSNGNFLWAIRIGADTSTVAGSGSANGITVDGSNNIYLTGGIDQNGTLDFDPGPAVVHNTSGKGFLVKYDSNGNFGWVSGFGNTTGTGASGNGVYFSKNYLYVTGATTVGIGSIAQLLVRKIDLLGTGIWEKRVDGANSLFGYSITADNDGNVITTGFFNNTDDFDPGTGTFALNSANGSYFIQKLDADGNFMWAKNFNEVIKSVAIDSDNNIFTAGSFSDTVDFDPNQPVFNLTTSGKAAYIQKIDANGYLLWAGQFGNSGSEISNGLVIDNKRNIYVAGNYSGTQDLDPNPSNITNFSSNSGSQDIFVLKLKDPQAFITTTNGNWNIGSTWRGGIVPPSDAAVIVRHTVNVTNNASCYFLIVEKEGGSLTINNGINLSVTH